MLRNVVVNKQVYLQEKINKENRKKMCVYHYEDSRRADCWIKILLLGCLGFSAAVSIPMFILTYPGDECLLFVSVRGEALIYGNPAGCNFIAYGHGIIGLIGKRENLHFNLVFLL